MPPVPTYAAENLWNYRLRDPTEPADDPDNIVIMSSFTGSLDEAWFFALPTVIEARGGPIIPGALDAIAAAANGNSTGVARAMQEVTTHIKGLSTLLPRMYENCNPDAFYNHVRPFLSGTYSATLPDGIFYEAEDGSGSFQKWKGPTAAQSSLFHFMDIVLGVVHLPTGVVRNEDVKPASKEQTFLEVRNSVRGRTLS